MSALVCLYVVAIGALVAAGAVAVEWGMQGRAPARHVWTTAMIAALVLPPLAIVQHARGAPQRSFSPQRATLVEVVQLGRAASATMGTREPGTSLHALRLEYQRVADRIARVTGREIVALWTGASLALVAWIAVGVAHWRREIREWEEVELDGVRVHLSAATGPAVLGVRTQRIVLPMWARTIAPEYRRLMLAHECEHIAARDPQRLAFALGALVLMPWNPALWWCAARMRRAIEMDCDARVLRLHPSPREYGSLLLQVAARGNNAGPLAVPLVNLLRLPSELELRLRAMTRPRIIARRTALAGGVCAVVAAGAAFTAPVPHTTRPIIRNLVQATRVRLTRGQTFIGSAIVHVGGTELRLDSAMVTGKPGVIVGRMRSLRANPSRDTIPSAVAEDSIRRLARRLAEQAHRLDSVSTHADSLDRAMRMMRARAIVQVDKQRGPARLSGLPGDTWLLDDGGLGRMQVKFRENTARLGAEIDRYYPGLAGSATPRTTIVFLADSTGHVLRTMSREYAAPPVMSAERAPEWFDGVRADDVDFVSMQRWDVGTLPISVGWIELKR